MRVDTYAVLSSTITRELFQSIPLRNPKVFKIFRPIDQLKLPQSRTLHSSIDTFDVLPMPNAFGVLMAEQSDHNCII